MHRLKLEASAAVALPSSGVEDAVAGISEEEEEPSNEWGDGAPNKTHIMTIAAVEEAEGVAASVAGKTTTSRSVIETRR